MFHITTNVVVPLEETSSEDSGGTDIRITALSSNQRRCQEGLCSQAKDGTVFVGAFFKVSRLEFAAECQMRGTERIRGIGSPIVDFGVFKWFVMTNIDKLNVLFKSLTFAWSPEAERG